MAKVGEYPDYISRPDDEEAGLVECKVYGKQEVLDVVRGMPAGTRDPLIFDEDQIVDIDCLRQFEHQRPTIDDTCPPMDQVTQSFALMSCGQHDYLRNFLWKNWKLSMDPVLSNGNCLFAAIRQNLNLRRTGWPDQPFFPNRYLRRQVVVWLAENSQLVLEKFGVYLKGEYGVKGELLGDFPTPVSYTQYLLAQLKNGTWGDLVVLYACSCMWDFRVTVLTAAMVEWRFRHNLPLGNTDMAILHSQNHFSTLRSANGTLLEEKTTKSRKHCALYCHVEKNCDTFQFLESKLKNCILIGGIYDDEHIFSSYGDVPVFVTCAFDWCSPCDWVAGDGPALYRSFETTTGLQMNNGAQFIQGKKGKGITTNHNLQQWAEVLDVSGACLIKPETCDSNGGSLTAWVNFVGPSTDAGIISSRKYDPSWSSGVLMKTFNSNFYYYIGHSSIQYDVTISKPVGWFHLALVYHGSVGGITVYHNGIMAGADTTSQVAQAINYSGPRQLEIGRHFGHYTSVSVDELTLWNRALSHQEISKIYDMFDTL